ncbi:PREDICTED: HIG1 domain family member 2A, mitochondrial [Vollenhovia emeryi]|uniref:HIG1 domain family member 2A, mitochondrial n=1 Tax=Vollenhovia emeryi TaxID=411798 RepID=UPI0005F3F277|nr:PREDICTED: HIG1 domain family member 2A, mitochondrial [Vollenhovia emeryi]
MAGTKPDDELDWVKIREDLDNIYVNETILQRAKRKSMENPLVPIGTLATTAALTIGLVNLYTGNVKRQQQMMRARVAAQSFTVICMVVGFMFLQKSSRD